MNQVYVFFDPCNVSCILRLHPPIYPFTLGFPAKILYGFFIASILHDQPISFSLELVTVPIVGEVYKL
jgi:flagellar biosynthesis protein FliR